MSASASFAVWDLFYTQLAFVWPKIIDSTAVVSIIAVSAPFKIHTVVGRAIHIAFFAAHVMLLQNVTCFASFGFWILAFFHFLFWHLFFNLRLFVLRLLAYSGDIFCHALWYASVFDGIQCVALLTGFTHCTISMECIILALAAVFNITSKAFERPWHVLS